MEKMFFLNLFLLLHNIHQREWDSAKSVDDDDGATIWM